MRPVLVGVGLAVVVALGIAAQSGAVFFSDNFDNGSLSNWQVVSGNASVVSGTLDGTTSGTQLHVYSIANFSRPFRLEFDLVFLAAPGDAVGKHAGVFLDEGRTGQASSMSSYFFTWIDRDHGYQMGRQDPGTTSQINYFQPGYAINTAQTYHWRIDMNPQDIRLYVDGSFVGNFTDATHTGPFYVDLWAYDNSEHVAFDNVTVTSLKATTPDTVAIMSATLIGANSYTSAIWDGQNAYLFGGNLNGAVFNQIVRYNVTTDAITTMGATLPSANYGTSAVWTEQVAYIFGAEWGDALTYRILRYVPSTDTLTTMSATLTATGTTGGRSAVWDGTNAYIFGGGTNLIQRYNPDSDTITVMNAVLPNAPGYTSAIWTGQYAYVFGGRLFGSGGSQSDLIVRYDPATDTAATMTSRLPSARGYTSAIWDGAYAYIFGGAPANGASAVSDIIRYDTSTDVVDMSDAALPTGRHSTSAIWTGADAYVFGGRLDASDINDIVRFSRRDTTPPVTTAQLQGLLGNNGWYRSSVTVTLATIDAQSGVASTTFSLEGGRSQTYAGPFTVSGDGPHSVSFFSTDGVGNQGDVRQVNFQIDATPPALLAMTSPNPNVNGWNNQDVTVSWSCTDGTSGVTSVSSSQVLSSEGASQVASGTCSDFAGNSASATISGISIDKTAPSLTGGRSPLGNAHGWNSGAVTVSFACDDGLSGVATLTQPIAVAGEGADQAANGACDDKAGNSADVTVGAISIDITPPAITGSRSPEANSFGWNNEPVTVSFSCADSLAGVASFDDSTILETEDADQSVTGTCQDKAGNTAATTVRDINIDKTAPSLTGSRSPLANVHGWNNGAVTVSFACDDGLSGVATLTEPIAVAGEGSDQAANGTCDDKAGNSADVTVGGINIDLTPPIISGSRSPEANSFGWNNEAVTVTFACTDGLAGVASFDDSATLESEGADQSITGTCEDRAGNNADVKVNGVNIDLTSPELSRSIEGTQGNAGWWRSNVTVTLSCEDALSGVDSFSYTLDGSGHEYQAPFGVSGDGHHVLEAECSDEASNVATIEETVRIDTTPPMGSVASDLVAVGPHTVNWSASDATSGVDVVEVQERALLGLLTNAWEPACVVPTSGHDVAGACIRDPDPGQYCYRVLVIDVAGNPFTSMRADPSDTNGLVENVTRACTIKVGPAGMPLSVSVRPSSVHFNVTTLNQSASVPAQATPAVPAKDIDTPPVEVARTCVPPVVCVGSFAVAPQHLATTPEGPSVSLTPEIEVSFVLADLGGSVVGLGEFTTVGPLPILAPTPFGDLPVELCPDTCPAPAYPVPDAHGEVILIVRIGDEVQMFTLPVSLPSVRPPT